MSEPELKPCPFCGGEARLDDTAFWDKMTVFYRIRCIKELHALDQWDDTPEEACTAWNTRSDTGE